MQLDELPDTFIQYLKDQNLTPGEKEIEQFHYWMREHTDLSSGSIVDYRKYVAEFLDQDGNLHTPETIESSHKRAAVSKYQAYLSKKTGENDE